MTPRLVAAVRAACEALRVREDLALEYEAALKARTSAQRLLIRCAREDDEQAYTRAMFAAQAADVQCKTAEEVYRRAVRASYPMFEAVHLELCAAEGLDPAGRDLEAALRASLRIVRQSKS